MTNEEVRLSSDHNSQKSPVFLVNMFHELRTRRMNMNKMIDLSILIIDEHTQSTSLVDCSVQYQEIYGPLQTNTPVRSIENIMITSTYLSVGYSANALVLSALFWISIEAGLVIPIDGGWN